jgi:hypothetical protein
VILNQVTARGLNAAREESQELADKLEKLTCAGFEVRSTHSGKWTVDLRRESGSGSICVIELNQRRDYINELYLDSAQATIKEVFDIATSPNRLVVIGINEMLRFDLPTNHTDLKVYQFNSESGVFVACPEETIKQAARTIAGPPHVSEGAIFR